MVTCVTAVFLADDVGIEFLRRLVPGSVTSGYMGRDDFCGGSDFDSTHSTTKRSH